MSRGFFLTLAIAVSIFVISVPSGNALSPSPASPVAAPVVQNHILNSSAGVFSAGGDFHSLANSTSLNAFMTFSFRNQAGFLALLTDLQDQQSPLYHRYLSRSEFRAMFSPNASEYYGYAAYFRSLGFTVSTYADRMEMGLGGTAGMFDSAFHTDIAEISYNGRTFHAPVSGMWLSHGTTGQITGISGLNTYSRPELAPLFTFSGSGEKLYGSDMQVAYQLNRLYQAKGYPVNETVATILWSGNTNANFLGTNVGPFVPSDISYYLNNTLPTGEPHSPFYGYPVNGAPLPGPSAGSDVTGAALESTLDLEMAASAAPGASIVEVYGPQPTYYNLNTAFAEIMNPNSTNPAINKALANVSVISNSWGSPDTTNAPWTTLEEVAAARGITVTASSGDNGNAKGPAPSFPASFAYDSYGTLSVGGTETTLSGSSSMNGSGTTGISSQTVWYETSSTNGSQGGVSSVYPEPSWQNTSSDANSTIRNSSSLTGVASGRGTPDVAGVAYDMVEYVDYRNSPGYYTIGGTSIAAPLVAGIIADINNFLGVREGFMNPLVYIMGQLQYEGAFAGVEPFYFITNGSNAIFSAQNGYSLVTGWGSINAYNFAGDQLSFSNSTRNYSVTFHESGLPSGANWSVSFSSGSVFTSNGSGLTANLTNGTYAYRGISSDNRYSGHGQSGSFIMEGHPLSVNITFSPVTFMVTAIETSLPTGTHWYLNLSDGISLNSSRQDIMVKLMNGTYSYRAATSNKKWEPSVTAGTVNVTGFPVSTSVNFIKVTYAVTFTESGLPSGTQWSISIGGHVYQTLGDSVYVYVTNGTLSYHAISVSGYVTSNVTKNITVNGSNVNIVISYSKARQPLYFETHPYITAGIAGVIVIAAVLALYARKRRK